LAEIYVPIDYSYIRKVIPQGEDILYSTMCKMIIDEGFGPAYTKLTTWNTHVLMTKSGFAMNIPNKKQVTERKFIPWYEIKNLWPSGIRWGLRKHLDFIRDPNFETIKSFKKRRWEFPLRFIPFAIESRKNRIVEIKANPTKFKPKNIRSMKNMIYNLDNELKKLTKKATKKIAKLEKKK